MTKNWMGLSVLAVALAVSASTCLACGEQAQAADAKDVKTVAVTGETKGCDMPCCAHANVAANEKNPAPLAAEKPCSATAAKGCPKKPGTTVAAVTKAEPVHAAENAEPAIDPGSHR